eukprot:4485098-Prorocentrum_lima.AAC.1
MPARREELECKWLDMYFQPNRPERDRPLTLEVPSTPERGSATPVVPRPPRRRGADGSRT